MTYKNVNLVDYRDQFYSSDNHQLIDVRSQMEYAQGHLPNAINIPLNELGERINEVSKDQPVVLVCQSGGRSMTASEALANAGFSNIHNLEGGTMVWMMNGLPLE